MLGFRYRTRQDVILRQHGLSASWNLLGCPLSARSRSPSRLRLGTCRHSCARLPAVNSPNRPPMAKPGCTCCPATSGTDPLATLGIDPSWMCFSVRLVGPFLCPDLVPVRCRAQLRSSMAAGHRRSRPRSVLDGNEHDARLRPVGMNHHAGSVCRAAVGFCSSPLRRFSRSR
jgi:hypothetical protein